MSEICVVLEATCREYVTFRFTHNLRILQDVRRLLVVRGVSIDTCTQL